MMPESNKYPLFELINSMTGPEKRYFKIFTSRHVVSGSSLYTRLFDLISRQKEYHEKLILSKEKKIKAAQIHNIKKYLYEITLKSLESFHVENSIDGRLRRLYNQVLVLWHKALYTQCLKLIRKTRIIAEKYQKLTVLADLLSAERAIISNFSSRNKNLDETMVQLEKISEQRKQVLEMMRLTDLCDSYNKSIFAYYHKYGLVRNVSGFTKLDHLTEKIEYETNGRELAYHAKTFLYNAYETYYMLKNNSEKRLEYSKKHLEVIESSPELLVDNLRSYIVGLNNYMNVLLYKKQYPEVRDVLIKLRGIEKNHSEIKLTEMYQSTIFQLGYIIEMKWYTEQGIFKEGLRLVKPVEAGLGDFAVNINNMARVNFYINLSVLYFGAEEFQKSLVWLNKILNHNIVDTRQDIYCFARIINLILHYELGNSDLLEHQVRSTYRYLSKREGLHKFESAILRFIRKRLSKVSDREDLRKAFSELKEELEQIIKDPLENIAFEYFDMISWLESKIENKSFAEVVKMKAGKT